MIFVAYLMLREDSDVADLYDGVTLEVEDHVLDNYDLERQYGTVRRRILLNAQGKEDLAPED